MSLVWFDGFEDGQNPGYTFFTAGGVPAYTTTAGEFRTGLRALEATNTSGWSFAPATPPNEAIVGVALNVAQNTSPVSEHDMLMWRIASGASRMGGLSWGSSLTDQFQVRDANGIVDTIDHTWSVDGYDYFELRVVRGNPGVIEVRINGTQVFLDSTVDTDVGTGAELELLRSIVPNFRTVRYDDLYIVDVDASGLVDFLDAPKVYPLVPDADGTYDAWTPLSGSDGWAMVDETPEDGDTSYISTATSTDRSSFDLPSLPVEPKQVRGVQINTEARKDGDPASLQSFVRTNGSDFDSSSHALGDTYATFVDLWEENPDTSEAWTIAEVNALQIGVEAV